VSVPLDWDEPAGGEVSIFIARQPATLKPAVAQLWLLQGGPGGSSDRFDSTIADLAERLPGVDIYVLEHRGVGESTRLGCPEQEAPGSNGGVGITASEWPACLAAVQDEWGASLSQFTITADARDLKHVIDATRAPDQKVFIYGVSYGTARAIRYLQLHPDGADGVILDSIVAPGLSYFSNFDKQYNQVAQSFAQLCAADSVCSAKMGSDPWARVASILTKVEGGHCSALGLPAATLKSLLPGFIRYPWMRPHLFAALYRLDRCDAADVQALSHYILTAKQIIDAAAGSANRSSQVTYVNIMLSELWEQPSPTLAELDSRCANAYVCPDMANLVAPFYDTWPRYPRDMYADKWPTFSIPILAMNGDLDAQTPIWDAKTIEGKFEGAYQTFVTVPRSTHNIVTSSKTETPNAPSCGTQMLVGFVKDPRKPIDTSCLSDLEPVRFTESPDVAQKYFGTTDIWENPAPLLGSTTGDPK